MSQRSLLKRSPVPAPFVLPVGCAVLLVIGALAAAAHGHIGADFVLGAAAAVTIAVVLASGPGTAVPMAAIAWMTATAFARAPYGELHPAGGQAELAGAVIGGAAVIAALVSVLSRRGLTLVPVEGISGLASAVDRRRRVLGVVLGIVVLPSLTVTLASSRAQLSLADDLLLYLIVVVAVAVVGGFWPAVCAAIGSSLLLNWYLTPPLHTFTIEKPDNLLALMLFIIVAMAVSAVVHLAARRAQEAALSNREAESLLALARTALADDDSPSAVLRYLYDALGVTAELLERNGSRWSPVAMSGDSTEAIAYRRRVRDDLQLVVRGGLSTADSRMIEAAAGQAAAALDRDRLRIQASQAEALAAGNRMRTALLAAVSHDLRTPLASIKASISSLRQTDVAWTPEDEAELLETIDESTDRLDALIANLLDMSRLQTGALQPYLQSAAIDEVAPLALRGLVGARSVQLDIPETLSLIRTDPGLLERALANLLSNALRHSPPDAPPTLLARQHGDVIDVSVVDHGPGVAAEDRERIFEPFQRLGDQDTSTGVGLGLAVARGFVETIGGTLVASDTAGGGLTMTVTLPIGAVHAAVPS